MSEVKPCAVKTLAQIFAGNAFAIGESQYQIINSGNEYKIVSPQDGLNKSLDVAHLVNSLNVGNVKIICEPTI